MRIFIAILLCGFPQSTEPYIHQLDLEPVMRDDQTLRKLSIMYDSPTEHGFQLLFVRGDGTIILQTFPGRPIAANDVPTCKERISQDQVKDLLSLIIKRHFWELPEKQFLFIGGPPSHGELELHRISISNGTEKAGRVFGFGTYGGKHESIPDDFAIIERQLKSIEQSAFSNKPCHLAPAVQF